MDNDDTIPPTEPINSNEIVYTKEYYDNVKKLLIACDHEYHILGTPRYNDGDYDALMRMFKRIEQQHPDWILPDSPSQTVGAKSIVST